MMKNLKHFKVGLLSAGLFIIFVGTGIYLMDPPSSSNESVIGYRAPSSIYDLESTLDDQDFQSAVKKTLLGGLKVTDQAGFVGVELGGFELTLESGERIFACDEFPQIILIFEGEGVASSGSKPQMEVESPCIVGEAGQIGPIYIPVEALAKREVFQGEVELDDDATLIRFYNTLDSWPSAWALTGVYLEDSLGVAQVEITLNDLIRINRQPAGFSWPLPVEIE